LDAEKLNAVFGFAKISHLLLSTFDIKDLGGINSFNILTSEVTALR
jgi:hypothetical protein